MADTGVMKEHTALAEVEYDDEEVALVSAAAEPAVDPVHDPVMLSGGKSEAQMNGVMVLSLLDKIIGVVDQIQHTQNGLEARQEAMEKSVSTIQGELTKMSKNHVGTTTTVNKMLDKVRKVSVNVKTVRSNLEKQAGQIKKLESNESELLKRRNFKVLIYQDQVKPPKASKENKEAVVEANTAEGLENIPEEGQEGAPVNSDEEVEIEEIIEESRTKRLQRSTKEQVDNIKKAFSKEQMEKTKTKTKENFEKTRQKTKENLEKTRQKTRDNLEKTKHSLEKKMGKLGTRMTPNMERRAKMKSSKDKVKKSLSPEHTVYARSKTTVYRVPPFTFHVKKIRDGQEEQVVVADTEMEEVAEKEGQLEGEENGLGVHLEVGGRDLVDVEEDELVDEEEEDELADEDEDVLVDVDGPQMSDLLQVTEDSHLVRVEADHMEKAQRK